jgi:hypothetical protein
MADSPDAGRFLARLEAHTSAAELHQYERFFPLRSRGEDVFIGVRMGHIFALAKEFMDMPLDGVERLLESPVHEARVGAVSIMDFQARSKTTSARRRKALFDLYMRRHDRINTWDLVDRGAIHVVGGYLFDKSRDALYALASSQRMAERRTAIVSTLYFIGRGDVAETFTIAELLLRDEDELIHKATGWALRSAGGPGLLGFLDTHARMMPRTMLRQATEKLDKAQRDRYKGLAKGTSPDHH